LGEVIAVYNLSACKGGGEGDGLADCGSGGGRGEGDGGLSTDVCSGLAAGLVAGLIATDVDVYDVARCGRVVPLAGEGGEVGARAGGADGLGEGDLAVGVGLLGDVVLADVVEDVKDRN